MRSNSDQRYIPLVDNNPIWARTSLTANNGAHPQLDLSARWNSRSALRPRSSTSRSPNFRLALYSDHCYILLVDNNSIWARTSLTANKGGHPQLDLGAWWTEPDGLARRSTSLTRSLLLAEKLAGLLLGLSARSTSPHSTTPPTAAHRDLDETVVTALPVCCVLSCCYHRT